jgi:hypothetical protein
VSCINVAIMFMQEISSPIRDLGVNRSGAVPMSGALRCGQGGFQVAVKALSLDRQQSLIAERSKSPQSQIDSHTRHGAIENRCDGKSISFICRSLRHTDIQIPTSATILTEASCALFEVTKTVTVLERQPTSGEVDLSRSIANGSDLERDPAQRAASTATLTPGQSDFSKLAAPSRIFFCNFLHRLHRQMQRTVTARCTFEKGPEIKSRQEPPRACPSPAGAGPECTRYA